MKPSLRFPEFTDDWSTKKIGDILIISNGRDYKHLGEGDIPVYGTGGYMLSVDDYLYEGESVAIGRKGTIDKPQFLSGKFWTVDTLFYTRDYADSCPRFVFEIFNNINWQRYNEATSVPSLSKLTIEKIKVNMPSKEEQEKIAEFLTVVDERIGLASRKVEKLQTYKRGLTQKIFTRTLRFKRDDGSDFPEWEEKKLGDIGDFQTSSVDKVSRGDEQKVFLVNYMNVYKHENINNETIKSFQIVTAKDNQIVSSSLNRGDILFTPSSETSDDIGHSVVIFEDLENAVFSYHLMRFRPKIELDILYSHYFCNIDKVLGQLSRLSTGSTRFTISVKAFSGVEVQLPCLEEQQKIATFLSQVDEKITLETEKLEELKKFKKALWQRMFV